MESCPQRKKKRPKIEQQSLEIKCAIDKFWFWLLQNHKLPMDIFGLTKYTDAFGYNSDKRCCIPHPTQISFLDSIAVSLSTNTYSDTEVRALSRISHPIHSKHQGATSICR